MHCHLHVIILGIIAVFLSGCLDHEQHVVINNDGSVIVSYLYIFPENQRQTLENAQLVIDQWQRQNGENMPAAGAMHNFLNEEALKSYFSSQPDIELRHYKQTTDNGLCRVQVIVLGRDARRAINSGIFGAFQLSQNEQGLTTFVAELPSTPTHWDQPRLAQLRSMLDGLRMKLSVSTPAPIRETSGRRDDKATASWAFAANKIGGDATSFDLFGTLPAMTVSW